MLEEIKTFIKRLKSDFHLDEIEKSLYFVNQNAILSERLANLDEKKELQRKSKKSMGIDLPGLEKERITKNYKKELEVFKRACTLEIRGKYLYAYYSTQIATHPKKLDDKSFLYEIGDKIYILKKKRYDLSNQETDLFELSNEILFKNKCMQTILLEDPYKFFSFETEE
jgi:hypothetical protein